MRVLVKIAFIAATALILASAARMAFAEPSECAVARKLLSEGKAQQAIPWRRLCAAKMNAQPVSSGSPARAIAATPPAQTASALPFLGNPPAPGPSEAASSQFFPVGPKDPSITRDENAARDARVELGVFGITLGQPLNLPTCVAGFGGLFNALGQLMGNAPPSPTTCRVVADGASAAIPVPGGLTTLQARRIANVDDAFASPELSFNLVTLAADRCPDWVSSGGSCTVSVTTKNGFVVGVGFLTASDDWADTIDKNLARKYGKPPSKRDPATCQNNASAKYGFITKKGENRVWRNLAGILLEYFPFNGLTCDQGKVIVEMQTFQDIIDRSIQRHETSQPQM